MCRERHRESRTAGHNRMQKGKKQFFPCFGRSAQHRFPVRRKFIPEILWFLFSFGLSFFKDFCLSLILQFQLILNTKHLILQALCGVISVSCWQVTVPQCDLCANKSIAVIDSKVLYLMQKMASVVECFIPQGKGKKIILLHDFTQQQKTKSQGIISLT